LLPVSSTATTSTCPQKLARHRSIVSASSRTISAMPIRGRSSVEQRGRSTWTRRVACSRRAAGDLRARGSAPRASRAAQLCSRRDLAHGSLPRSARGRRCAFARVSWWRSLARAGRPPSRRTRSARRSARRCPRSRPEAARVERPARAPRQKLPASCVASGGTYPASMVLRETRLMLTPASSATSFNRRPCSWRASRKGLGGLRCSAIAGDYPSVSETPRIGACSVMPTAMDDFFERLAFSIAQTRRSAPATWSHSWMASGPLP
jgi:hypothetical protein